MQGDPAAVVYRHDGQIRPYVYVSGNDGRLYVCYYDYTPAIDNWVWADLKRPNATGA